MNIKFIIGGAVLLSIMSACALTGMGYEGSLGYGVDMGYDGPLGFDGEMGDDDAVGFGGGFYEPGYAYGGWGDRYQVGPPRGEYARPGGMGRFAPSIPDRPRGR